MPFMELQITAKGALYCADCAKCGATLYSHEWATGYNNDARDALQDGTYRCPECGGTADPDTFTDCGQQYAGRYSAPGYLDCTEWHFGPDADALADELRDMYGEDEVCAECERSNGPHYAGPCEHVS
jgi:DNA-directed RNA polymerase subunit RPC12/RpoP